MTPRRLALVAVAMASPLIVLAGLARLGIRAAMDLESVAKSVDMSRKVVTRKNLQEQPRA